MDKERTRGSQPERDRRRDRAANARRGGRQEATRRSLPEQSGHDPTLSGGDIDARWEDAESGGDETVGGSTATPGQNDLDEMGKAVGVTYADTEELKIGEKRGSRDKNRWELDPASSEDYGPHERSRRGSAQDSRHSSRARESPLACPHGQHRPRPLANDVMRGRTEEGHIQCAASRDTHHDEVY